MAPSKLSPRIEVVRFLAKEVLSTIEGSGEDNITPSEVLSTAFTVTAQIMKGMLSVTDPAEKEHNVNAITDAIAQLYAMLPERTTH